MSRRAFAQTTAASVTAAALAAAAVGPTSAAGRYLVGGESPVPHRGVYEVTLAVERPLADPFQEVGLQVMCGRPDGSQVVVDGFYDGLVDGRQVFRARAYADTIGPWTWRTVGEGELGGRSGRFTVVASALPGKLRQHPADPHQFAYDNGAWFLHVGDTGYRYVVAGEPAWQAYLDQAAALGVTKIRTWFCQSRGGVEALFTPARDGLALPYWQEIDRRVQWALDHHPGVILQLIPYGEDTAELLRYGQGDRWARLVARAAQARWSALPNVTWCVSNDREIVADGEPLGGRKVPRGLIDQMARDLAAREPWGTLLTNHQCRFSGYDYADAPWSDVVTLEDLDQVDGALLLAYRARCQDPVVNDEDRYELYRPPAHPRFFFRRLMWASLLSGGHATYGGLRTYEPHDGRERGVRGYQDARREGLLTGGADDFGHLHTFFREGGVTLVGLEPRDDLAGGRPAAAKLCIGQSTAIAYFPNPTGAQAETANVRERPATGRLTLLAGRWTAQWFDPRHGRWHEATALVGGAPCDVAAPFAGDAVLLLQRQT